jgi:hypothetical protein
VRKELPIVAAFTTKQVHETVARLIALNIGRDLIGIRKRVNGRNGHAYETVHLLSVLASPRRRDEIESLLLMCDALSVGSAAEMSAAYGVIPHPGVFQDGDVKLPMGSEYHSPTNHGSGDKRCR